MIMPCVSCMTRMAGMPRMVRLPGMACMVVHVAGVSVSRWLPIVMIVVHVHMHVLVFFHSDIRF